MNTKLFSPNAKWIWLASPTRDTNIYACFRKTITLAKPTADAVIHITADARYELLLNGHALGQGPIRSFKNPWPVDRYDVGHLLREGINTVAILVHHIGLSTFQYLDCAPGLIAELTLGSKNFPTDATWKCTHHAGYAHPVPRISCQQGWEEQLDARIAPGSPEIWTSPNFDDQKWPRAKVVPSAHKTFELNELPFLTRDAVAPVAVREIESVRPAPYTFNLNPHDFLNKQDRTANHIRGLMLLTTTIHSPRAQAIQLHQPHGRPDAKWKLNNALLSFDDHTLQKTDTGVAHSKLKKGVNVLMCLLPEIEHFWWAVINIWTDALVSFTAPNSQPRPTARAAGVPPAFLAFGPFQSTKPQAFDLLLVDPAEVHPTATRERFDAAWSRGELSNGDLAQPFARTMTTDMVVTTDIYALSSSERRAPNSELRIDNPTALLSDNDTWTTIHPPSQISNLKSEISPRLLLDFGHELIGPHEFELDAPAGAIIDNHNFEFIQRDGRYNLAEGMNNSFRYICREGVQTYRTFIRRGFRYSWFTFRNFNRPIRIRHIRALFSTYPQTGAGSFESSDALLNEIWKAGVLSVRCCSEDTYTDCPSYEQTFWVGDARNEAMVDLVANGDPRLSAHSLKLAGRSLDRSPIVESQVPSGWQNLLPTWSFLWMRWAQEHYQLTGDKPFINGLIPFIERNVRGIETNINRRGLFQLHAWNLFDWAGMDTPAGGIVTHVNCFAVLGLRQCADLARQIGSSAKGKQWSKLADKIETGINQHLWSDEKQAYVDCIRADGSLSKKFSQQTQTAAYISGVAKGVREQCCREIVHNAPPGFITAGSPFYMFFLLEALAREGRVTDLLATVRLLGKTNPGRRNHLLGNVARERSAPYPLALSRLVRRPCCFPHTIYIRSSPALSGLLANPNYGSPPNQLPFAQGIVPTPHGPITCYWTDDKNRFTLRLSLPEKITAEIRLPYSGVPEIISGKTSRVRNMLSTGGPDLHLTLGK